MAYLIDEENHSDLAVARTVRDAIDWLVDTKWLTPESEVWNSENGALNGKSLEELGRWEAVHDLTIGELQELGFYLTKIKMVGEVEE